MAATTMHVPQGYRVRLRLMVQPGHAGDPLGDLALRCTGSTQATEIALDVGSEHGNSGIAELLGQTLQGHCLTGAGGSGNQPVPIGQAQGLAVRFTRRISAEYQTIDCSLHQPASLSCSRAPDGALSSAVDALDCRPALPCSA